MKGRVPPSGVGAAGKRLRARVLFPFERPYLPFVRWAMRAKAAHSSPLGLLIHRKFGLWRAYRGALLFKDEMALPPPDESKNPCDSCGEKPCLGACPVNAFDGLEYDASRRLADLASAAGKECLSFGCAGRNACMKGTECRYGQEQMRFHMQAFAGGQFFSMSWGLVSIVLSTLSSMTS